MPPFRADVHGSALHDGESVTARRRLLTLLLLLPIIAFLAAGALPVNADAGVTLTVTRADDRGVTLRWRDPAPARWRLVARYGQRDGWRYVSGWLGGAANQYVDRDPEPDTYDYIVYTVRADGSGGWS